MGAGVASKGGTVSSYSDEQQLDVHYHCLRQGEAMITITIPVGVYADVVFAWKKVCKKEFVTGLSVGLMPQCDGAPCEDVVSDGHAQVTATKTRHFFLRGYSDLFLLFRWHSSFFVVARWCSLVFACHKTDQLLSADASVWSRQVLFDTAPSAEGKRMVVDKETKESVFYVQLSGAKGDLDYTEPYISSDPPICSPRVSGVMRKVGQTGDHHRASNP